MCINLKCHTIIIYIEAWHFSRIETRQETHTHKRVCPSITLFTLIASDLGRIPSQYPPPPSLSESRNEAANSFLTNPTQGRRQGTEAVGSSKSIAFRSLLPPPPPPPMAAASGRARRISGKQICRQDKGDRERPPRRPGVEEGKTLRRLFPTRPFGSRVCISEVHPLLSSLSPSRCNPLSDYHAAGARPSAPPQRRIRKVGNPSPEAHAVDDHDKRKM